MKKFFQNGSAVLQIVVALAILALLVGAHLHDRSEKLKDARQHQYMREHNCGTVNAEAKEQIYKCDHGTWTWGDLRRLMDV